MVSILHAPVCVFVVSALLADIFLYLMAPPRSRIGPATDAERAELLNRSPLGGRYNESVERESAYELLNKRKAEAEKQQREDSEAESRREEQ